MACSVFYFHGIKSICSSCSLDSKFVESYLWHRSMQRAGRHVPIQGASFHGDWFECRRYVWSAAVVK